MIHSLKQKPVFASYVNTIIKIHIPTDAMMDRKTKLAFLLSIQKHKVLWQSVPSFLKTNSIINYRDTSIPCFTLLIPEQDLIKDYAGVLQYACQKLSNRRNVTIFYECNSQYIVFTKNN